MNRAVEDVVHQACMSYLAGRVLTIYYKRNFSLNTHYKQVIFDSVPVFAAWLIAPGLSLYGYLGVFIEILALVYSYSKRVQDEMVKTLALSTSWYFAVYGDLSEETFDNLTLVFATTQFMRKPDKCKEYFREVRIVFGPIYVILMCAGLRFLSLNHVNTHCLIISVGAVSSVVASVFFRPDNSQTLQAILPSSQIPSTTDRQTAHGLLMFLSLLVTFFKVLKTRAPPMMLPASFGALNILLFFTYKLSRLRR